MISIEKIVQQLQQCKDTSITLPISNDSSNVQKSAVEIRKYELELLNNNFEHLTEANYTMDTELEKMNNDLCNNTNLEHKQNKQNKQNNMNFPNYNSNNQNNTRIFNQDIIPNKSLIIYMENETANIPEILLTLLNNFKNIISFEPSEWYIYGVKNPESFYKSFLLLSKIDFIIKNRIEMKNEIATFKREMAMKYEDYYKTLNYRKLKFKHNEMINNLTNIDNYTEFDALQFVADYNKINYIILDIVSEKYIDIKYNDSLCDSLCNTSDFIIIVKYAANTYLPLMNSNGKHSFSQKIIDIISKNFERIVIDNFKEPSIIVDNINSNISNIDGENNNINNIISNPNECEGYNLIYNIEDAFNIDLSTIDSTMITSSNQLNNINTKNTNNTNNTNTTNTNTTNTNTSNTTNTNTFISKITNPIEDMIEIEEQEIEPIVNKINNLDSLLCKIPMKTLKNTNVKQNIEDSTKNDMEELKPLAKYNLVDLQMMAKFYKVDTQKMGTAGKKINKLKSELYDEIKVKI